MLNKHDIANIRHQWDVFWTLTRYGQYDRGWGIVIGFVTAWALHLVWG